MKVSVRDLYRLRHATLAAQRAQLQAQVAQQVLRELLLELERRYGLLTREVSLDVQTGRITENHKEAGSEPERYAHPSAPRPAR